MACHATWTLVVAYRGLGIGKTRLDLPLPIRRDVSVAMLRDTVAAARHSCRVREVLVVTADRRVPLLLSAPSVHVLFEGSSLGINDAFRLGAQWARRRAGPKSDVAFVPADLPSLTPAELSLALGRAVHPSNVVADSEGTGTTMLAVRSGVEARPRFGRGSLRAHVRAGAVELRGDDLHGVRSDVDTLDDLAMALAVGCGTHTERVVRRTTATWSSPPMAISVFDRSTVKGVP